MTERNYSSNPALWILVALLAIGLVFGGIYLFGQKPVQVVQQAPVATAPSISAPAPTAKEQTPAAVQADDISFTAAVSETSATMRFPILGAVFDEKPNVQGIVEERDDNPERKGKTIWALKYEDNPGAFAGAKLYALATRSFWPGGKDLKALNLASPKITGQATIGQAKYVDLSIRTLPTPYQIRVWVAEFPSLLDAQGKPLRAWVFHPMGQYLVLNKYQEPQTAYKVVKLPDGTWKTEVPGTGGQAFAAQSK